MTTHLAGHPPCANAGHHTCNEPSGRTCLECDAPAGTTWGPYWCPDHDSTRLERNWAALHDLGRHLAEANLKEDQ